MTEVAEWMASEGLIDGDSRDWWMTGRRRPPQSCESCMTNACAPESEAPAGPEESDEEDEATDDVTDSPTDDGDSRDWWMTGRRRPPAPESVCETCMTETCADDAVGDTQLQAALTLVSTNTYSECFAECASDCTMTEVAEWMASEGLIDGDSRDWWMTGRRRPPQS